jgi:hypothetical protein
MTSNEQRLNNVITSLDRVPQETKQMIFSMTQGMSEQEIIQSFNQKALDLFTLLIIITTKIGKEDEYKMSGYKNLFDNAIKINAKLPVDKFTLLILEFAAEIYAEEEDCFLNMSIPDTNVNVGNEFGIIRSEMFKKLWVVLNKNDKNLLKENIILLTTFAHTYLYKTLIKNKK